MWGKTVAIDAGKKLSTPKSQVANVMVPPKEIAKKVNEVIAKYDDTSAINLNKRIDGSSVNCPNASNAIANQDLVKRLNGSGLNVTTFFFLLVLKIMADILKFTETPLIDRASKRMTIMNMILLQAPILVTVVISKLVSNRKTCSLILARAT